MGGIVDVIVSEILSRLDLEGSTYPKYTTEEKQEFAEKVTTMIEENILSEATTIGPDEQEQIIEVIITEVVQKLESVSMDGAADKEEVTADVTYIVNLILGQEVSGPEETEVEMSIEPGTEAPENNSEPATEVPEAETEETTAPEVDTEEEVDEEESESMEKGTVNTIVTSVMEKVADYAEEKGPINLPELDTSQVTSIAEAILAQIEKAVGEENMSEEVLQSQADNIADLIAANYIDLEVSDESLKTEIEFDLSKIFEAIQSVVKVQFELDREGEDTEPPTLALTESPTDAQTEAQTEAPTPAPTEAPTPDPTEAPTEVPTESPTEAPTEAPTESPTVSEAVVESNIVTKATEKVKEDMLEEQADKLAQLIANDFIELEVTEGGEPIDMTGEDLMDIISSIASMTFDMVYIKESQITPSPTLPPTESPTEAPTEAPTESPTVSEAAVESTIVTKATEKVKEYVDEGSINIDTDRISSVAEDVLS